MCITSAKVERMQEEEAVRLAEIALLPEVQGLVDGTVLTTDQLDRLFGFFVNDESTLS